MNQFEVDSNWQRLPDGSPTLQRLVRVHTGMVVGRVLRSPASTQFSAEVWSKGMWTETGKHNSYDDAIRAVVKAAQLVR